MNNQSFVPVNTPLLAGNEKKYVLECLETGWISSEGPFVAKFEEAFAKRVGRAHGISCANGSVALDMAVAALKIGPGDEVIMPSFTIISPAASVVRAGAVPVFVDSDPVTWNMDVNQIEPMITAKTKAIIVVHIYGLPVDMDPVLQLASKYGLAVIEDAAEMHGQTYKGRPCGSFGDISTFSFYANKHITTGEGGMVVANDAQLADRCRSLRNLCFRPEKRFVHDELGWNFRLTNIQAALGLAQLEMLDETVKLKRRLGETYRQLLDGLSGISLQATHTEFAENIYWVFGILLEGHVTADPVMRALAKQGIGSRPFFWPMHLQPVFESYSWFKKQSLPFAEKLGKSGLYLPSGSGTSIAEIVSAATSFRSIMTSYATNSNIA